MTRSQFSGPTQRAITVAAQRSLAAEAPVRLAPHHSPAGSCKRRLTDAELLSGAFYLADLRRPQAPALALPRQAGGGRRGDPIAPLPGIWRRPIRRSVLSIPGSQGSSATIRKARLLHIPSTRLQKPSTAPPAPHAQRSGSNTVEKPTTVPSAIQADGSVDILGSGDQPGVVEEVRHWSRNQTSRNASGVSATLLHLEPLPTVGPAVLSPERPASSARPSPTRPSDTAVSAASSRPAPAREAPASALPPSPLPAWQPSLSNPPTPPAPAAAIPPQPPERALLSPAALQEPAAATPTAAPAP